MRKYLPLLFTLVCAPLLGQQSGAITGHVQAPGGAPASGVQVIASRDGNGLRVTGQTDDRGNFTIANVSPGSYQIFAGAVAAPVTVAGQTMQVVVVSRPTLVAGRGEGTYFPRTSDPGNAAMITVSPGETTSTVEITLAPKTTPFVDLPLRIIRGRFATEGGGAPAIGSNELKFLISDSPANLYSEVSFRGEARSPAVDSIRFQSLQGPRAFTSVLAMPTSPDGQFRLLLPEGLYRVSSQGPTKDNGHDPRYYVKGISFGKIDLMKELMPIGATTSDELVITLAKCRDSKDPLCA